MTRDDNLGFYKHRNLPHLDLAGAIQFITFVLADAAPANQQPRRRVEGNRDGDVLFLKLDAQLDRSAGECLLGDPAFSREVVDVICDSEDLGFLPLAWVVMPNHVHMVIVQSAGCQLGRIVGRIKARSATRINRLRGVEGKLWQSGYFDRMIRSMEHLWNTIEYVHENPVQAGLAKQAVDWEWSTARTIDLKAAMEMAGKLFKGS
ncbi:MAG: transposase [bacterium]